MDENKNLKINVCSVAAHVHVWICLGGLAWMRLACFPSLSCDFHAVWRPLSVKFCPHTTRLQSPRHDPFTHFCPLPSCSAPSQVLRKDVKGKRCKVQVRALWFSNLCVGPSIENSGKLWKSLFSRMTVGAKQLVEPNMSNTTKHATQYKL